MGEGERSFADLRHLLDGWFHQDFDLEGDDLETILPKYVRASPPERVRRTVADIDAFLSMYGNDDGTLRTAVERVLEPEIVMEGLDGMTTREWLGRVRGLLALSVRGEDADSLRE